MIKFCGRDEEAEQRLEIEEIGRSKSRHSSPELHYNVWHNTGLIGIQILSEVTTNSKSSKILFMFYILRYHTKRYNEALGRSVERERGDTHA